MPRVLLLVTVVVALFSAGACNDRDRPGTIEAMPTADIQAAASPESEATSKSVFHVPPDADELVIPTISENELESSSRIFTDDAPSITVEGSSIIYSGSMSVAGHDRLLGLARRRDISELVISSPGGSAYWGIKIGEIVYEYDWNVRVRVMCFSACANYVFPAGRTKIIEEGGIVGWHGSARQHQLIAEQRGISSRQQIVDGFFVDTQQAFEDSTQEEFQEWVVSHVAKIEMLVKLEQDYYERIGVDSDISDYGHFPQRLGSIKIVGWGGWTFTLEDMAKFGLDGIIYEGSDAYPSDRARALLSLTLLEVDDR